MFSKRLANHLLIAVILVLTGVTGGKIFNIRNLGDVDVTVSSSSLNSDATLTSGGLFQSDSTTNQWLRIDLLEAHFITSFGVYTGQGTQHDQIHLLGRLGGDDSRTPNLNNTNSWRKLQISRETNRVSFLPSSGSGQEVPVYRRLAVFSTSNSGLSVDKVTFFGSESNAFLPSGVTLNFSPSGSGYCATCQWNAPDGLSILLSYKASLTGDPSLIEVGQDMSTTRCGYTRGQEVTCEVVVKGATTSASRVQMVPCTVPTKPDVTGLSNPVEVTHSGRRRWRYTVSWSAPSSTGCLYIRRYKYSYQGGNIQNLLNNTNSIQIHADGSVRVTLSIRACNNQDICSVYDDFTSVPTHILRPQIAPLDFRVRAHSTSTDCVRLSWSPPQYPNGEITEYQYNCGGGWQSAGDGSTRSIECAGGGFTPYQSVTCHLKARNSAGDSNVSTKTTRTKCGKPSLPRSTGFGDRSVAMHSNRERWRYKFSWNVPSLKGCNSISRYEYSYNGGEVINSTTTYVWFYADGKKQTSFRVKACNNQNYCSDFQNSNNITTRTLRPQITPLAFTVGAHSTKSDCVRLSWSPPQYPNGEITEYQYNCDSRGWQSISDGSTIECAGDRFTPYQSVSCHLVARNSAGFSNVTNETGRTRCAAPAFTTSTELSQYVNENRQSSEHRRLKINIPNAVRKANCANIRSLHYKLNNTGYDKSNNQYYTDLPAVTTYRLTIRLINNEGMESETVIYKTTGELPPGPIDVYTTTYNKSCVMVYWRKPEQLNGIIRDYQYRCRRRGTSWPSQWTIQTESMSAAACGYTPGQHISCQARASTSEGYGPESASNETQVACADPASPVLNVTDSIDTSTGRERVTLNVTWPAVESNCDSITSYKVTVSVTDSIVAEPATWFNGSPGHYFHSLPNLSAYTNYTITITATNNKNHSTSSEMVYLTRELKPYGAPTVNPSFNASCVSLEISEPDAPNGIITQYSAHCGYHSDDIASSSDMNLYQNVTTPAPITFCSFTSASKIQCVVTASNSAGESPAEGAVGYTDLAVSWDSSIDQPIQQLEKVKGRNTPVPIIIKSVYPNNTRLRIRKYMVIVDHDEFATRRKRSMHSKTADIKSRSCAEIDSVKFVDDEYKFRIGDGEDCNKKLLPDENYTVHVAVTVLLNGHDELFAMLPSFNFIAPSGLSTAETAAVSSVIPIFITLVGVSIVLIYLRRRGLRKDKSDNIGDDDYQNRPHIPLMPQPRPDRAISCSDFSVYVERNQDLISQQYQALQEQPKPEMKTALLPENQGKCRYKGLYAGDNHRVLLDRGNSGETDFVNASYIDGFGRENKFIAAQGPMLSKARTDDFWLMIWQQKPRAIVMVTGFFESGKAKCAQYIPEDVGGVVTFAGIEISLYNAEEWADYTVNTLKISKPGSETRTLRHYYYRAWPDHGVPKEFSPFIGYVKKIKEDVSRLTGSILVHCSAGVGRTGTYISLDYLLEQAESQGHVNPYQCVSRMRERRPCMVQTVEQYHFLHQILNEALLTRHFTCSPQSLISRIEAYEKGLPENSISKEFSRIEANIQGIKRSYAMGEMEENLSKNRYQHILPDGAHSIYVDGNYINAIAADDYRRKKHILITQLPLSSTIFDFWTLIIEQDVKVVVQLQHEVDQFYPAKDMDTLLYGKSLYVTRVKAVDGGLMTVITLSVKNKQQCVQVDVLLVKRWREDKHQQPTSSSLLHYLGELEKYQQQTGDNKICITDMDGSTRCGIFISAFNAVEKLKAEQEVDLYNTVLMARTHRPQFVSTLNEYVYLYHLIRDFTAYFSEYANFQ